MQASRHLGPTGRVDEREFLTDTATKGSPAVEMFLRQDGGNPRTRRLVPESLKKTAGRERGTNPSFQA